MASPKALRGEVWQVDLDPIKGHEQGRVRPALIISVNDFNKTRAGLLIVVPITSTDRGIRTHVRIDPPEGGLSTPSFVMCERVRSISVERLVKRRGIASDTTMRQVEDRLRMLQGL